MIRYTLNINQAVPITIMPIGIMRVFEQFAWDIRYSPYNIIKNGIAQNISFFQRYLSTTIASFLVIVILLL